MDEAVDVILSYSLRNALSAFYMNVFKTEIPNDLSKAIAAFRRKAYLVG